MSDIIIIQVMSENIIFLNEAPVQTNAVRRNSRLDVALRADRV